MNECICTKGFTGPFCEFHQEHDELLYIQDNNALLFNSNGVMLENKFHIESNSHISLACSAMLNGETVIFGGSNQRQVSI